LKIAVTRVEQAFSRILYFHEEIIKALKSAVTLAGKEFAPLP